MDKRLFTMTFARAVGISITQGNESYLVTTKVEAKTEDIELSGMWGLH